MDVSIPPVAAVESVKKQAHFREKQHEERNITKGKGRVKFNDQPLDPMDPASYSDVPRYYAITQFLIIMRYLIAY